MKFTAILSSFTLVTAMSACSSSSSGNQTGVPIPETDVLVTELVSREGQLRATIGEYELDGQDIPTSGTASYSGLIALHGDSVDVGADGSRPNAIVGDLKISIGFSGDGSAAGTIDNFYYVHSSVPLTENVTVPAVEGALAITDGIVVREDSYLYTGNDSQLIANVEGEIDFPDNFSAETSGGVNSVGGLLYGKFYENGIDGKFAGSISGNSELTGVYVAVAE